ncbi:hypothetical protein BDR03DRAFT_960309 [Suillus americanus]|nr:hypothetical protein BDR03DRAFT_960309 [Suillus americanus]
MVRGSLRLHTAAYGTYGTLIELFERSTSQTKLRLHQHKCPNGLGLEARAPH